MVVRAAATKQHSEGRKRLGTKHQIAGRRAAGPNLPTTHKAEYHLQQHNTATYVQRGEWLMLPDIKDRNKVSLFYRSVRTITQSKLYTVSEPLATFE